MISGQRISGDRSRDPRLAYPLYHCTIVPPPHYKSCQDLIFITVYRIHVIYGLKETFLLFFLMLWYSQYYTDHLINLFYYMAEQIQKFSLILTLFFHLSFIYCIMILDFLFSPSDLNFTIPGHNV